MLKAIFRRKRPQLRSVVQLARASLVEHGAPSMHQVEHKRGAYRVEVDSCAL